MDKETANQFADAFMAALPDEAAKLRAKMEEAKANGVDVTPQHFAALDAVTDAKKGFCTLWPQANKSLDQVEFWINFVQPSVVAVMNAIEAAINQTVFPMVCGAANAAAPATKPPETSGKKS